MAVCVRSPKIVYDQSFLKPAEPALNHGSIGEDVAWWDPESSSVIGVNG